jgi:hypothetical protein
MIETRRDSTILDSDLRLYDCSDTIMNHAG